MSKKENQQFTTKAEIHHWLKKMGIKTYTIDDNLVVDVDGTVNLYDQKLSFLPFQFGKVSKNFKASLNELTSLKGTPNEIGGYLDLSFNKITSLEYLSHNITGGVYLSSNNIQSLLHCPNNLNTIDLSNNKISSLLGMPKKIGRLNLQNNFLEELGIIHAQINTLDLTGNNIKTISYEEIENLTINHELFLHVDEVKKYNKVGILDDEKFQEMKDDLKVFYEKNRLENNLTNTQTINKKIKL